MTLSYLRSGLILCACAAVLALRAMASQSSTTASEEAKPAPAPDRGVPFSREWLLAEALQLSRQPYVAPSDQIPNQFANLSFDQYRDIRFHKGASIWEREGRGFTIDLF